MAVRRLNIVRILLDTKSSTRYLVLQAPRPGATQNLRSWRDARESQMSRRSEASTRFGILLAAALLMVGAMGVPALAQVKPGDFITSENASQVKDLLSPGVYYKVVHNMTMKIVPTQRV